MNRRKAHDPREESLVEAVLAGLFYAGWFFIFLYGLSFIGERI